MLIAGSPGTLMRSAGFAANILSFVQGLVAVLQPFPDGSERAEISPFWTSIPAILVNGAATTVFRKLASPNWIANNRIMRTDRDKPSNLRFISFS
jgi:hypothetical protein